MQLIRGLVVLPNLHSLKTTSVNIIGMNKLLGVRNGWFKHYFETLRVYCLTMPLAFHDDIWLCKISFISRRHLTLPSEKYILFICVHVTPLDGCPQSEWRTLSMVPLSVKDNVNYTLFLFTSLIMCTSKHIEDEDVHYLCN